MLGLGEASAEPGLDIEACSWNAVAMRLPFGVVVSIDIKLLTQNWHGLGESDCLIKTKHCDGRWTVLTQCDFCPVL